MGLYMELMEEIENFKYLELTGSEWKSECGDVLQSE